VVQKKQQLIEEIFHLRLKRGTSQLENPMRLRQAKRDLARTETVLREREGK
jgi:large subunit ribosomal protein L29